MKWQDVIPVLISILVIILVALLEKQSKLVAAVTATMPLTVALGLWVVYASTGGEQDAMNQFTTGLLIGIVPSIFFLISVWIGARMGLRLVPLLLVGYAAWGLTLAAIMGIRRLLGI